MIRTFLCTASAVLLLAGSALAQDHMPLTTDSKAAKMHLQEAREHLNNVEFTAARDAADAALKKDPNFAVALMIRGVVSDSYEDGKSYVEKGKALQSEVTPGEQHFIDAIAARRAGDEAKVKKAIQSLVDAHPRDPNALFMLGQMEFGMRDGNAKQTLNRLLEIDPNYGAAYNLLGYRAMHMEEYEEAERMFKKYVELRPDAPNPYDSLAEFYLKIGDYDKAITNYKAAYDADSRYINAWTRAGLVMAMKGDVDKGEAEIRKALVTAQDAQNKAHAYDALTNTALLNDDTERALAVLDEASIWAATAAPERVSYFKMGEGWILSEYGRHEEAGAVLMEIQKLLDDDETMDENLRPFVASRATMASAFQAIANGDFKLAEKEIESFETYAMETGGPSSMEVLHELQGMLAYQQGDYELAVEHFAKAGDDPHIQYRTGIAYKELGQMKKAKASFKKAAEANEGSRSFALFRNLAMQEM